MEELWVLVVADKLELVVALLGENKGVLVELWVLVVADKLGLEVAL